MTSKLRLLYPYIFLFSVSFFIFTASIRPFNTTDSYPNNFVALNVLFHGKVALTEYKEALEKRGIILTTVVNEDGTRYSKTPPILGILSMPTFAVLNAMFGVDRLTPNLIVGTEYSQYIGKLSAAFYSSLSTVLIYWLAGNVIRIKKQTVPMITALVFAFGTAIFNTASQANWQHAISVFLILISMIVFAKHREKPFGLFFVGLLLGLYAQVRLSNGVYVLFFLTYLFLARKSWKEYLEQSTAFLLSASVSYLSVMAWYGALKVPNGYEHEILFSLDIWTVRNFLTNVFDILFSPNYGLFVYSPVLLFGIGSVVSAVQSIRVGKKSKEERFLFSAIPIILVQIVFAASWWMWTGGTSMNARLLIEILPLLCLAVGTWWNKTRSGLLRTLFIVFFMISVGIHILTTYMMDFHWFDDHIKRGHEFQHQSAWQLKPSLLEYLLRKRVIGFDILTVKDGDIILHERNIRIDIRNARMVPLLDRETVVLLKEQKNTK